jgi:undecaprenyl-diphosphatase
VALHLGTLIAVVGYFRRDLIVYVRDGLRLVVSRQRPATAEGRIAWLLVLSAVPAGLAGALFESAVESRLGKPWLIAVTLIVFGLLLGWADRRRGERTVTEFTTRDALTLGAAQMLALNPGTSRSGITITAARLTGFSRDSAARLSFLMSIPVIAGAVFYKLAKLVSDGIPDGIGVPMIVGIISAAISGWFAVWGTIRLLRTRSFTPFIVYRCAIGVLMLVLLATNVR